MDLYRETAKGLQPAGEEAAEGEVIVRGPGGKLVLLLKAEAATRLFREVDAGDELELLTPAEEAKALAAAAPVKASRGRRVLLPPDRAAQLAADRAFEASPAGWWPRLRQRRDELLAASDATQLADRSEATRAAWAPYREALRDLPRTFAAAKSAAEVIFPAPPRDVTKDPAIEAAATPDDLKAVWPDALK